MALLQTTRISTKFFSYSKASRVFSAEISTLEGNGFRVFTRAYDDACDVGFTIVSEKTGKAIPCAVWQTDYVGQGSDREVAGWRLRPCKTSDRELFHEILIIND